MKQKDIALIMVITFISAVLSFIVSDKFFVAPQNRQQKVLVVDNISSQFVRPSSKYFNAQSIDPTQVIQIGNNANQNPFTGAGH